MAGEADSPEAQAVAASAASKTDEGGNFVSRNWNKLVNWVSPKPAAATTAGAASGAASAADTAADTVTSPAKGTVDTVTKAVQGVSDQIAGFVSEQVGKASTGNTVVIKLIESAQTLNQKIPPVIFSDLKDAREKLFDQHKQKVAQISESMAKIWATTGKFPEEAFKEQMERASKQFDQAVLDETVKRNIARNPSAIDEKTRQPFVDQVEAAKEAYNKLIPPEQGVIGSAFNKAKSAVYDSEKGEAKWGGIIGGIAGLIGGSMLTGGMGAGIMGIISTILIAVVGVMLGGKVSEMIEERNKKPPETPQIPLVPKEGVKLGKEKTEEKVQEGATKVNFPLIPREGIKLSSAQNVTPASLVSPSTTPAKIADPLDAGARVVLGNNSQILR